MNRKIIEKILFIRRFEEKIIEIYHTDVVKSPVHLSIGQELFSVLLANQVREGDKIIGNYRSQVCQLRIDILNLKSITGVAKSDIFKYFHWIV